MRPERFLVGIAAAAIFVSSALAQDHPCVRPKDQVVVALCSDPELRAVADQQRNKMMALWNRLSPQEQDKFRDDQLAWRDITARRCRVDRPTPLPLSAETKICLGQGEAGRIAYLQHYGQTDAPTALHPNATAQGTPAASTPAEDSAYRDGLRDRAAWEQWFNGLQGDYKTGAFFWSSQRSLPKPGSCKQMNDDFDAGCTAAKTRLSASDTRRKTELDYKAGWNVWNPSDLTTSAAAAPAPQPSVVAPPVAPERQPAAPPAVAQTPPVSRGASAVDAQTGAGHAKTRWYVAHFGSETCVPLDDIDIDTMQRLYYGTGSMKTPEDLVAASAALGVALKAVPSLSDGTPLPDGTRLYNESGLMTGSGFALFDDQQRCQSVMGMLQK